MYKRIMQREARVMGREEQWYEIEKGTVRNRKGQG